jgi:cytochrome c553
MIGYIGAALVAALCALPAAAFADETEEQRLALQLVTVRCALCHGLDGESLSPLYPKLAGQHPEYITKQLFNFRTGQRASTVMKDVADSLLAADVRRVARYFSSQPISARPASDPVLAELGRTVYLQGNPATGVSACASCHGETARGGAFMPRLAGQHAEYLERQLRDFVSATRANDRSMHGPVRSLSEVEIRALAQYLSSLS